MPHRLGWDCEKPPELYCIHQDVTVYYFQIKNVFLSLEIFYVLTNGVDPDEMPHSVAFHQFSLFVEVCI